MKKQTKWFLALKALEIGGVAAVVFVPYYLGILWTWVYFNVASIATLNTSVLYNDQDCPYYAERFTATQISWAHFSYHNVGPFLSWWYGFLSLCIVFSSIVLGSLWIKSNWNWAGKLAKRKVK